MKKKIFYFTNIFPDYRKELWKSLINSKAINFHIFFSNQNYRGIGSKYLDSTFSKVEREKLHNIKHILFFKNIIWQRGIINTILNKEYDSIILLGDMKILSNWIAILICKLKGKEVCLWTHGIYGNENFFKMQLRILFLSLADQIFLYENRAKNILLKKGFSENKLKVVFNSINLDEQTVAYKKQSTFVNKNEHNKIFSIIFFGRLTRIKRVDILINAVIKLNTKDLSYKLSIIGDGPEKNNLLKIVKSLNAEKNIFFYNATYSEDEIAKFFLNSDLLVSPGNVGLNAVHSLSYGTPVITHNKFENQMPEHEIIIESFNGLFFEYNNLESLEHKIQNWFSNHHNKRSREELRNQLIKTYNPKFQTKIFENSLNNI